MANKAFGNTLPDDDTAHGLGRGGFSPHPEVSKAPTGLEYGETLASPDGPLRASNLSSDSLPGGEWLAEDIEGIPLNGRIRSSLLVEENGLISGSAGCNAFGGTAAIAGSSIRLRLKLASHILCPAMLMDREAAYLTAMESARSFEIGASILKLYNASGRELLRFQRHPECVKPG